MIVVDTSVWVGHFRHGEQLLHGFLTDFQVLLHPWVHGELALGNLRRRGELVELLNGIARAPVARTDEVLSLVERERLYGRAIGFVDAQLLASTRLSPGARLWTRDQRLQAVAADLGVLLNEREPSLN